MKDKLGRDHVSYGANGPSYIFFKSNRVKTSNISRHVKDILTMTPYWKKKFGQLAAWLFFWMMGETGVVEVFRHSTT